MRRHPPPKVGPHTGWTPTRNRAAQHHFRTLLLHRSHGRCERCGTTTPPLHAHHTQPGYTPDCGLLLCRACHHTLDPYAR